jgi:hypothetical protein
LARSLEKLRLSVLENLEVNWFAERVLLVAFQLVVFGS